MKILNQVNYIGGLGADWWIGNGWKDAFEDAGHEFFWYTAADDLQSRLDEIAPDILFTSQGELANGKLPVFLAARKRGVKVVMRVDSLFDRDPIIKDALVNHDPADIYFGEVEGPQMDAFKAMTRKPYVIIANAAHAKYHFPTKPVKKYECDIVFLGAYMPKKREAFAKLLTPLTKRYRVKVYGPNWTAKDNLLRIAALGARKLGFAGMNKRIGDLRMTIPRDEENQLYSSAKISINLHERGPEANVLLNERTFKIPACGGFEVCDFVPALRDYFTEEEMVMASPPGGPDGAVGAGEDDWADDWFGKIDYYMRHDDERRKIQAAGTARALRDHTYRNRVAQLLALLYK